MIRSGQATVLWETAQALNRAAAAVSPAASRLPPLLMFTDAERTPRPWEAAARLPAGAGVVYRHFGAADASATARRLRDVTAKAGVRLLIGLDDALADRVEADGVHLPQHALDRAKTLKDRRPDWIVTGAVHDEAGLSDVSGLDALVASPVFPTGGTSLTRPVLGVEALRGWVREAACQIYALGGVDVDTIRRLEGSGVCGVAGVSAFQQAFGGPDHGRIRI